MKILTLNTWQECGSWEERWGVIFEGLARYKPDIAGFQEMFNSSWAEEVQKRTRYSTLLFPKENCGQALYTHFPVKSSGIIPLFKSQLEEYFRYVLWAELDVKGHPLFVFNTHFSWRPEDVEARKHQAGELMSLLQEKAGDGEVIVMGDLNAARHSLEIKGFVEQGRFRDLLFERHPADSNYTWDNRNPYVAGGEHKLPDRRIDFILTRGSGPLLKDMVACDLVFNHPNSKGVLASDHYGILAEFK